MVGKLSTVPSSGPTSLGMARSRRTASNVRAWTVGLIGVFALSACNGGGGGGSATPPGGVQALEAPYSSGDYGCRARGLWRLQFEIVRALSRGGSQGGFVEQCGADPSCWLFQTQDLGEIALALMDGSPDDGQPLRRGSWGGRRDGRASYGGGYGYGGGSNRLRRILELSRAQVERVAASQFATGPVPPGALPTTFGDPGRDVRCQDDWCLMTLSRRRLSRTLSALSPSEGARVEAEAFARCPAQ